MKTIAAPSGEKNPKIDQITPENDQKDQRFFSSLFDVMKNKHSLRILAVLLSIFVLTSCSNDDEDVMPQSNLTLNINGLEDLGSEYVYEGWILANGNPVTTGRFTADAAGKLSQTSFPVAAATLDLATAFILTIEPATGDDPAPSEVHILAGDFSGQSGTLTVSDPRALGSDFSTAAGKYILATPTNNHTDDEFSGVWFLDNSTGSALAGLSLPQLPAGWIYEGWVVVDGTPLSTGTFSQAQGSDSFSGFSGPNAGPAFPGEDFLTNAPAGLSFPTDIRGGAVVISIEPTPDNSSAPFLLKPLIHHPSADALVHTVLEMGKNLGTLPTGSFSRK